RLEEAQIAAEGVREEPPRTAHEHELRRAGGTAVRGEHPAEDAPALADAHVERTAGAGGEDASAERPFGRVVRPARGDEPESRAHASEGEGSAVDAQGRGDRAHLLGELRAEAEEAQDALGEGRRDRRQWGELDPHAGDARAGRAVDDAAVEASAP